MPSYNSNLNKVTLDLKNKLKNVGDTNVLEKTIATSLAASNQSRIHNEGKKVDGSSISAPIKGEKQGAYSKGYAKTRNKKGRQTQRIDLSFSGELQKSFQPSFEGKWVVGFLSTRSKKPPTNGQLYTILTERYGEVWGISRQDDEAIGKTITAYVKSKL